MTSELTPALENLLLGYSPEVLSAALANLTPNELREFEGALEAMEQEDDWNAICKRVAGFDAGPLLWLTKFTKTEDEHWLQKGTEPIAPFPAEQYFVPVLERMMTSLALFIIKSREMMTSWLACGYIGWMCITLPQIFWLLQTEKEDKVVQLINYVRILHRNQPEWLRNKNPLVVDNTTELRWRNGSHVLGLPKGVNQVRLYHPYGYLMDEAAFLPEAEACYNAVRPVAKQIIAVSSDGLGWFHNESKLVA